MKKVTTYRYRLTVNELDSIENTSITNGGFRLEVLDGLTSMARYSYGDRKASECCSHISPSADRPLKGKDQNMA